MVEDTIIHRTFWDLTKFARPGYYQPDTFFGSPHKARQPVEGSSSGYQFIGGEYRPVDLIKKPYQDFTKYCTKWERYWSALVDNHFRNSFNPVVGPHDEFGQGYPVVGHIGKCGGDEILVPRGYGGFSSLSRILGKGVPAFVPGYQPVRGSTGDWETFATSEELFTLLTSVDGTILKFVDYDVVGLEEEDPIMDLIVGKVLADVGIYAVKKLIGALVRRAWGPIVTAETNLKLLKEALARKEGRAAGSELADQLRREGKRVVVNIGGTGEVADAINVNPNVVAPRKNIPNHIARKAEVIGELFGANSVDEIVSNSIPPNTYDWRQILPGAHKVLRPGTKITIRFTGVGEDADIIIEQVKKLGFKEWQNGLRVGTKVVGEGAVITAVK
jgi:hypothetical protein